MKTRALWLLPIALMVATQTAATQEAPILCEDCSEYEAFGAYWHDFAFGEGLPYYCTEVPCHGNMVLGSCYSEHNFCDGWPWREEDADEADMSVMEALVTAHTTGDLDRLVGLVKSHGRVAYFAPERQAVQAVGCDGVRVVLHLRLSNRQAQAFTD